MEFHDCVSESEGQLLCRICHAASAGEEDPGDAEFIDPCVCTGSVRWVHRSCLDEWRAQKTPAEHQPTARAAVCELCGFSYQYVMHPLARSKAVFMGFRRFLLWALPVAFVGSCVGVAIRIEVAAVTSGCILGLWSMLDSGCLVQNLVGLCRRRGVVGDALYRLRLAAVDWWLRRDREEETDILRSISSSPAPMGSNFKTSLGTWHAVLLFIFPVALPQLLTSALLGLRDLLGHRGFHGLSIQLAAFGVVYVIVAFLLQLAADIVRPPLARHIGPSGLPVVRSLTVRDRELLAARSSVRNPASRKE